MRHSKCKGVSNNYSRVTVPQSVARGLVMNQSSAHKIERLWGIGSRFLPTVDKDDWTQNGPSLD